ncbi:MAG: FkbM family methyltransferase [Burkholderiaceae bacterium]
MVVHWRPLEAGELSASGTEQDQNANTPFGALAPTALQRVLIALGRRSVLKRGLFRTRFANLIMALRPGPLDIDFRHCGYRIRCEDNLIECGLLLNPAYNGDDIDFLISGASSDANFVDIGSNIGLYSLPMAKSAPEGKTIAIDPNPLMAQRLAFNAAGSGLGNVTIVPVAISDTNRQGALKIRLDDVAIVALEESTDGDVPIRTLVDVLAEHEVTTIYGLKIDIEGHEDQALVPFLSNAPTALLPQRVVIEHSRGTDYPGCLAELQRLGYQLHGRSRNNSFYLRSE